jgi:polyferredoxin
MIRRIVQIIAALIANCAFLLGQPFPGSIYQGPLKRICSPGLNCYSCPYAIFACPIGTLQNFAAGTAYRLSLYVTGFLVLIGTLTGRLVCGWICPCGLVQELLHRLPSRKIRLPPPARHLRWASLVLFVFLFPALTGQPSFCRFLCPAGTLEAGAPLVAFDPWVRSLIGTLFGVKAAFLVLFALGAIFICRFFCQTACPLGLIYGFFNRVAVWGLFYDPERCLDCGACARACPVSLRPREKEFLSGACIRCLKCLRACPRSCFRFGSAVMRRKF